jgi:hypothetical protein
LTTDRTLRANTSRVFTGAGVDNGIDKNLYNDMLSAARTHEVDWLSGTDLDGVLVGEKVNDLKRVCHYADGEELLAVVTTLHHQTFQIAQ